MSGDYNEIDYYNKNDIFYKKMDKNNLNTKIDPFYIAKKFTINVQEDMDKNTDICYVEINKDKNDNIFCENGDQIIDNTIVEFKLEVNKDKGTPYNWKPMRVRYDKSDSLKKYGLSGSVNDYNTALSVWHTIKNPVTEEKIRIRDEDYINSNNDHGEDKYYIRHIARDKSLSKKMLDFNNYWVKNNTLISRMPDNSKVLDLACGKGGDTQKYINANFSNILGIDLYSDNIENSKDGAWVRYIESIPRLKAEKKNNVDVLFVSGDCGKEFKKAIIKEEDKDTYKCITGKKDSCSNKHLMKFHNMCNNGSDVVSCQFAIHYFCENNDTLDTFLNNISKSLKNGGYFIGTCLDGHYVNNLFKNDTDVVEGKIDEKVIWMIQKDYEEYDENNDGTNINMGKKINVFVESIGKVHSEFLVDFKYLAKKLREKNLRFLNSKEIEEAELTDVCDNEILEDSENNISTCGFGTLFSDLQKHPTRNKRINDILEMSDKKYKDERTFCFLNRWFIFRKDDGSEDLSQKNSGLKKGLKRKFQIKEKR